METILRTKSGNEVYLDEMGDLLIKGNPTIILQELEADLEDMALPKAIHETSVVLSTIIVSKSIQL